MRRLVVIAVACVFLTLVAGAALRVASSGAYVARSVRMRIHEGMTREEVNRLLADVPLAPIKMLPHCDCWKPAAKYFLVVTYDLRQTHESNELDFIRTKVTRVEIWNPGRPSFLDEALEFFGYPSVREGYVF